MHSSMNKVGILSVLLGALLTVVGLTSPAGAKQDTEHKVTICHRTNSVSNPYVQITVDYNAADGSTGKGNNDHTHHNGPVFDFAHPENYPPPHNGDQWGDIIPPYGNFPGKNWPEGKDVYDAGCAAPGGTTTSSTPSTTSTTSSTTTSTTVDETTTTASAPVTTEQVDSVDEQRTPDVAARNAARPVELPATGSSTAPLALVGVSLVLIGVAFCGKSRSLV